MARTSLGPRKFILDMSSSSHYVCVCVCVGGGGGGGEGVKRNFDYSYWPQNTEWITLCVCISRLYKSMVLSEQTISQDINQVWKRFELILDVANGLINYAPVFRDYYYEALDSFRRDNVQYIEVRALLPPVSHLMRHTVASCKSKIETRHYLL